MAHSHAMDQMPTEIAILQEPYALRCLHPSLEQFSRQVVYRQSCDLWLGGLFLKPILSHNQLISTDTAILER